MYTIRQYNEKTDGPEVSGLLHNNGIDRSLDEFRGIGLVATEENTNKIVGFFWALAGLSSTVYLDYLVVDKTLGEQREDVFIDLCVTLLGLLNECGVKQVLISSGDLKVQTIFSLLGFKEKNPLFSGHLPEISTNLKSYFEATTIKEEQAATV